MQRAHRLDIHPSVVFQLGESLISDEVSAIVELVKNAYDADATWARVRVDTNTVTTSRNSFFPGRHGQVVVEDDGTGMDEEDIDRGWLTIANSQKREAKEERKVTPRFRRTPLGDKGLGRLGVQRLGNAVELTTRKVCIDAETGDEILSEKSIKVGIDWRSLASHESLSEFPVEFAVENATPRQRGTKIVVSDLRDPTVWNSPKAERSLERRLGQFISPFEGARPFRVYATVNGHALDLVGIADQLRDAADMRFEFSYSRGILRIIGKYALTAFRVSNDSSKTAVFDRILANDRGREFYGLISQNESLLNTTKAAFLEQGPWFIETHSERVLDRLAAAEHVDGRSADPGPFHGEIDSYDFGRQSLQELAGTALSDFRKLVQQHSGIRVYRDEFAIRPYGMDNDDWLQLGATWTTGSSYYGLRPKNTVGFVSISARENAQLEEKTDREGFVDSSYTRNFLLLMRTVVDIINRTTTALRRQYNVFQDLKDREVGSISESEGADALFSRIRDVSNQSVRITSAAGRLARSIEDVEKAAEQIVDGKADLSEGSQTFKNEIDKLLTLSEQNLNEASQFAERAAQIGATANILERDLERVQDQLEQFAELAALGLAAEAITHELSSIASGLVERTRNLMNYLRSEDVLDQEILAYTEYIRSASTSIRKQLSHLEPGLRYVRESTEEFSLRSFLQEISRFYRNSFSKAGVRIVLHSGTDDLRLRMNRGRLTQIIDNLFLNAKYWLQRDLELGKIAKAELHLALDGNSLLVWDTGRGVDPAIEGAIFEPFVTNKPRNEGRGLGLFVVRQLLQANGASITLLPETNTFGSRYIFRLDLGSVVK